MANDFRNTDYFPGADVLYTGDTILEVDNPNTYYTRKEVDPRTGRPGPSRRMQFPKVPFLEYPKMMYHAKEGRCIVANRADEEALPAGWTDKAPEPPKQPKRTIVSVL